MIDTHRLTKTFGKTAALDHVTFRACAGERIALVGPNGAGKTTLLRILSTYLPATSGEATVCGCDLQGDTLAVRRMVGYLPEQAPLYPEMRVAEYLKFRGRLRRMSRLQINHRFHEVIAFCDLAACRNTRIGALSNGLRHRVGIADALLHEPQVLLLDDPLAACDPYQAEKMTELLASSDPGTGNRTLIFSSHSKDTIRAAATRILCLERGSLVADTTDVASLDTHSLSDRFLHWQEQGLNKAESA